MKTAFRLVFVALVGLFYSELRAGHLTVTLAPAQAANAGAQWRVDGGSWRNSGATVRNLSNTTHQVDFRNVAGWLTPAPVSVNITNGSTAKLTATYVRPASLSVTLTPNSGQWRVDDGAWQPSGAVVANLTPGQHSISYSNLTNYATPPTETLTFSAGQLSSLQRSYTQLAQILIGLVPQTGQWRANGGAWQPSGTSLLVPPGNYLIEYSPLDLYDAPASENLTLAAAGSFATTRYYTSQKPSLRVDLTPNAGQWRIDGGAWQPSGTRVSELAAGNHTIDYTDIGGLHAPLASETVSLALRDQATLSRTYPWKPGSVTVHTAPTTAQWRVFSSSSSPNGTWQPSGATVNGLPVGSYTLEYAPLANHTAPSPESFILSAAEAKVFDRAYTPHPAQFSATLDPSFATWRITRVGSAPADTWNNSGSMVGGLTPGTYTVEYSALPNRDAPPTETVTLVAGQSLSVQRSYTPHPGALSVTLTPPEGRWRVDGGAWQLSGAVVGNLSLGSHTVDYLTLAGYAKPPVEFVAVQSGTTTTLTREYVQHAQLTVTLSPNHGQWRVDGGAWQTSGAVVTGLAVGEHRVDFSDLFGYMVPGPELVTLAAGENKVLSKFYNTGAATLQVTLDPGAARWRVDGGSWAGSGLGLMVGSGPHVLEFEAVPGYFTPPAENLTLGLDENRSLSRAYTPASAGYAVVKSFSDAGEFPTIIHGRDGVFYAATSANGSNGAGQIVRFNGDGSNHVLLKSFPSQPNDGLGPNSLVEGSDNVLYGTTGNGGSATNNGTIFKVNKDGSGYAIIHVFEAVWLGTFPNSLMEGSDGALYGTTSLGGSSRSYGVIFRINKDGSGYTVLRALNGGSDGSSSRGLIEGVDGLLYGTTGSGGLNGGGTVFKLAKSGSGFTVLKTLDGLEGSAPRAGLLQGSDGLLYGTTSTGGSLNRGVLFRLNRDGTGFAVLRDFVAGTSDGGRPNCALAEGANGLLYGTTFGGGSSNRGIVFSMNKDGSGFTILKNFTASATDGGNPSHPIVIASDGTLFGATTTAGGDTWGSMFKLNPDGTGFTLVRDLGAPDGSLPLGPVLEASNGLLYGTTYIGGGAALGTVFKVNRDGTGHTVVHRFAATNDGSRPQGPLIEASDGMIYGATISGNPSSATVYRFNKDGSGYAIVRAFSSTEASFLYGGVIEGSDGALYGTAGAGGTTGWGNVFRLNKDGSGFIPLHTFAGGPTDGKASSAPLIEGSDGRLYGTTVNGGSTDLGTVFAVRKDGTGYAVLHHFTGGTSDGATPYAGLMQASDGQLYGTTPLGGTLNYGTLFRLNVDGSGYAVVKHFTGGTSDGANPYYATVTEMNGTLYGVTVSGGAFNGGTLFAINKDGTGHSVIVNFGLDLADGRSPGFSLTKGSNRTLWGTTFYGGGGGTVFRLRMN